MSDKPIAVFDSGLGGLSVVRHLRRILPNERIVYFGDTARIPYGTKSPRTVITFALEAARFLLQFEPKMIVAACNTASAVALEALIAEIPLPVLGVVEPGAEAAARLCQGRPVAVLGTEATIASGAYPRAIHTYVPGVEVIGVSCPLFVPLVEEGWDCDEPVVRLAVDRYLGDLTDRSVRVAVLGCTHYPLLRVAIERELGPDVRIVDSGHETSIAVRSLLESDGSLCAASDGGSIRCYVSDNPARLRRVGSRFLDEEIRHVEFVAPEQYIASASAAPAAP